MSRAQCRKCGQCVDAVSPQEAEAFRKAHERQCTAKPDYVDAAFRPATPEEVAEFMGVRVDPKPVARASPPKSAPRTPPPVVEDMVKLLRKRGLQAADEILKDAFGLKRKGKRR